MGQQRQLEVGGPALERVRAVDGRGIAWVTGEPVDGVGGHCDHLTSVQRGKSGSEVSTTPIH